MSGFINFDDYYCIVVNSGNEKYRAEVFLSSPFTSMCVLIEAYRTTKYHFTLQHYVNLGLCLGWGCSKDPSHCSHPAPLS